MFGFNVEKVRKDFDVLKSGVIYFDSACMSLKPKQVVEKMNEYYSKYPVCAGRSSHSLARTAELEFEKARLEVAKMIGAKQEEVVFVRNATEGINLVANSIDWKEGDEVIVSDKEHNSNLIPWLKLKSKGVNVVVCRSDSENLFNLESFEKCFSPRTRFVSIVHVSNLDGVENPVGEIVRIAHEKGVQVLIDGAQSFPHSEINVSKLDVDFFVLSGHKALGPTGVGVLYGKRNLLESLNQFIVGGQTVVDSTYSGFEMESLPKKFEAGLQDYAGIIGFGEACRYLRKVGLKKIERHVSSLNNILTEELRGLDRIKIVGPSDSSKRGGIFSFWVDGMRAQEVAKILDSSRKIAVRAGAFCVHSWFNDRKIDGAVRVSLYLYNTEEEVRIFAEEIKKIVQLC